jgi:hypothetical protein
MALNIPRGYDEGCIETNGSGHACITLHFHPNFMNVKVVSDCEAILGASCLPNEKDEVEVSVKRVGQRRYHLLFYWNVLGNKLIKWTASE